MSLNERKNSKWLKIRAKHTCVYMVLQYFILEIQPKCSKPKKMRLLWEHLLCAHKFHGNESQQKHDKCGTILFELSFENFPVSLKCDTTSTIFIDWMKMHSRTKH